MPGLLLSGARDPFAQLGLLEDAATAVDGLQLVTWPRLGHSLASVRDEALDRVAAFLLRL
jgi:pimeloyl-ACP methyl ester carboxylesterase